eukprot:CAMPEP_0170749288 /NCGR_PEP_ID=MMETSP0437-20130122/10314_1 /TAXON_ID=0 /ORGANISM="Sexangularia sp." /LENGTH=126 /DNA_ID=CAMNT_0011088199 /DNA_START=87 /DNA_END=467 /DNA_ORIENTATION=-
MIFTLLSLASVSYAQVAANIGFYTSAPDSDDACSGLLGNVTIKVQSLDDCQPFGFSDASLVSDGKQVAAIDGQMQFWETQDCTGSSLFKVLYDSQQDCSDFTGTGVSSLTVNGMPSKGYVTTDLSY